MVGMGHSSGDRYSVLMVHGRWTEVAWQLRASVGGSRQMGSDPCGDMWSSGVSLGVSWGVDVFTMCEKDYM